MNALTEAGARVRGTAVRCPFHEDRHESGSLFERDGEWRYQCHAGGCGWRGDVADVRAKIAGLSTAEFLRQLQSESKPLPPPPQNRTLPPRPATNGSPKVFRSHSDAVRASEGSTGGHGTPFEYQGRDGKPRLLVVRVDLPGGGKVFKQLHHNGLGWVFNAGEGPLPLYNAAACAGQERVFVVEGEKCVEALRRVGLVAVCSPGGANGAGKADWTMLAGVPEVVVWRDYDDPAVAPGKPNGGLQYQAHVVEALRRLSPAPRVLTLRVQDLGLPPKGDVVDFLAARCEGMDESEVRELIDDTVQAYSESEGAVADLVRWVAEVESGDYYVVPWAWPITSRLVYSGEPGACTLLCGQGGSAKSNLILQALTSWVTSGHSASILMLEQDALFYQRRILAQVSGVVDLLNADWVKHNGRRVRDLANKHRDIVEQVSRCIHTRNLRSITSDDVLKWIQERIDAGCRVIGVDPITARKAQKDAYLVDAKFVEETAIMATKHGVSLYLVTHPTKDDKHFNMSTIAGGADFVRHYQYILGLEPHPPRKSDVTTIVGSIAPVEYNRTLHLWKTRGSPGENSRIAFQFECLKFHELGTIVPKTKKGQ